ncbi:MAG: glycine--tRNA ligase [Patescibacteria group bacterium]|nr:glycine--tRNA ligase [Patescibacteria group bacterium]
MKHMDTLKKVVALAKRRGFIFPGSQIYGGLANTYDYGPLGVEMLRNLKNYWWNYFVTTRENIYGLETSILMSPKVWQSSGHTKTFTDALIECKQCHQRTRADHLIENKLKNEKVEGQSLESLEKLINDNKIKCPHCGQFNWTSIRKFNLLFETKIGIVPKSQSLAYLRGETAQGMFIDFKQILNTMSPKLPFGLAQSGKCFRNEITQGQNVFRTLEFELAELEYYIKQANWKKEFEFWKKEIEKFALSLGINKNKLKWRSHTEKELSHYSKKTEDLEYEFPFGFSEWFACAYRTDFDLKNHMEKSGIDLRYTDPKSKEKFIPHVIEPTFGLSRTVLVLLVDAYTEEKDRIVLKLDPKIAPYKVAVSPLLGNKKDLSKKARKIFKNLSQKFSCAWDAHGNIGKRYRRQDEAGTPWCVTIDFDSLKDDMVTIRDRDTMKQIRIKTEKLITYFQEKL